MNINNTASVLNVCFYAPDIHPNVVGAILWSYWYLVGYGLFATGVSFGLQTWLMTVMGLFIQTGIGFLLWFIMEMAKWHRPENILTSNHCAPAVVFHDALNLYGSPDPIFGTVFIYMIFLIYMYQHSTRRTLNWFLIPIFVVAFVAYTVFEFLLGRIFGGQYAVNAVIVAVVSTAICLTVHYFYRPDYRNQLKILHQQIKIIEERMTQETVELQKRVIETRRLHDIDTRWAGGR